MNMIVIEEEKDQVFENICSPDTCSFCIVKFVHASLYKQNTSRERRSSSICANTYLRLMKILSPINYELWNRCKLRLSPDFTAFKSVSVIRYCRIVKAKAGNRYKRKFYSRPISSDFKLVCVGDSRSSPIPLMIQQIDLLWRL